MPFKTQNNFPTSPDVFSDRIDFVHEVLASDVNSLADSLVNTQIKVIENADGYLSRESSLGNPSEDGYVLVSDTSGNRSWQPKEDLLGNPNDDGYLLSSNTSGVRTWISQAPSTLDPTSMSAEEATRLGYYKYYHDQTYNDGYGPSITVSSGTLSAVPIGTFMPYQVQDGSWRSKLSISISVVADTILSIIINGINFEKSTDTISQTVAACAITYPNERITQAVVLGAPGNTSGNQFFVYTTVSSTKFMISGDLKLTSKPTWAY